MKKLFFLFVFVLLSFVANAKITKYQIYSVSIKESGKEWTTWKKANIPVTVDNVKKRIYIETEYEQIIDIEGFEEKHTDISIQLTSYATDTYYNNIYVNINILSKEEIYLSIVYEDVIIMYRMRIIE